MNLRRIATSKIAPGVHRWGLLNDDAIRNNRRKKEGKKNPALVVVAIIR